MTPEIIASSSVSWALPVAAACIAAVASIVGTVIVEITRRSQAERDRRDDELRQSREQRDTERHAETIRILDRHERLYEDFTKEVRSEIRGLHDADARIEREFATEISRIQGHLGLHTPKGLNKN